ncbi:universal stress protein UspA [Sediminicola luteus]|uniref:Universal stress protein UspA n=2 Tax=Sediminicola luteus TaxID=319238 RepID=A0A2A4GFK1_9FLAO|nr:universal stress protein UspA [Sediminicola luteus]
MEVTRIAYYMQAKLVLLHVGEKDAEKEAKIKALLNSTEHHDLSIDIQWKPGDPYEVILETTQAMDIDLLVLGALQHEGLFRFYVGSIARKLTRKVVCSVLLLIKPSLERIPCQHIVVNGLDAPDTPEAIGHAVYMAHILQARQLTVVEEIRQQEVERVEDDKSLKRAYIKKERLTLREDNRVKGVLNALPQDWMVNINLKTQSIFGRRGYSIGHYAEVVRADLLVMNAPLKTRLWDRLFPHDIEHILSDLPTDLLIIRPKHGN